MKSSDQGITLRYLGDRVMSIRGFGKVEEAGDLLLVSTREGADRLLSFYPFEEVDPSEATTKEDEQ